MDDQGRGRVLLLNGRSSSGKSTLARALLPLLDGTWFHVPVDAIGAMRSTAATSADPEQVAEVLHRTRLGYHRVVAALASVGNDVVMDYPLSEPWRLDDLLTVLEGYDVTVVEVWCDPEELARREIGRGDRPVGLAASQDDVHAHGHDLRVDTTRRSAEECAREVVEALPYVRRPALFERLRG